MPRKKPSDGIDVPAKPRPRLRIVFGEGRHIGPGKIDLLEAIGRTGSISAAARSMGMSYRRAWLLVESVNEMFEEAATRSVTGGANGGGAEVTPFGHELIAAYRRVETATRAAIETELKRGPLRRASRQ